MTTIKWMMRMISTIIITATIISTSSLFAQASIYNKKLGDDVQILFENTIAVTNNIRAKKPVLHLSLSGATIDQAKEGEDDYLDYMEELIMEYNSMKSISSGKGDDIVADADDTTTTNATSDTTTSTSTTNATSDTTTSTSTTNPTSDTTTSTSTTNATSDTTTSTSTTNATTSAPDTTSEVYTLTLSDESRMLINITKESAENITEISLSWTGSKQDGSIGEDELCLHSNADTYWYGAYQSYRTEWPLSTNTTHKRTAFNYIYDFGTDRDNEEFYLVLEHLYVNTNGFAIWLDSSVPWFVHRVGSSKPSASTICFSANNSLPYWKYNSDPSYRTKKVRIIAANDIRQVLDHAQSEFITKPNTIPDKGLFQYPTWTTKQRYGDETHHDNVEELVRNLNERGLGQQSMIIFNNRWEHDSGDFKLNHDWFGNPNDANNFVRKIHNQRYRISVQVNQKLYKDKIQDKSIFLRDHDNHPTDVVDFSNKDAVNLYTSELNRLHLESNIDSYYIAIDPIPQLYGELKDWSVLMTPSLLAKRYVETVTSIGDSVITTLAYRTQHLPNFVQLTTYKEISFEQQLASLIPTVLAASIGGYSFVIPYTVGGFKHDHQPNKELYIRWVQAVSLLPSMSFGYGPWRYDQDTVEIVRRFIQLHSDFSETMIDLANLRVQNGTPIIRPMWYAEPDDAQSYTVSDQFMLGDDVVVAPILVEKAHQRAVYLPSGTWSSGHGLSYTGPTIINVPAPLDELPYFVRKK